MKIIIAIDSFKGSLSSTVAGQITKEAIKKILPEANIIVYPLADGGEGTVNAIIEGLNGDIINAEVTGPIGNKITSRYGKIKETAIIEMAEVAGLTLVPVDKRNPLNTTTYGLGELILQAAKNGCRDFIIGIGGSATNDCGLGMLSALGFEFKDIKNNAVGIFGRDLQNIHTITTKKVHSVIKKCRFRIACDVNNPLTGENGCSKVYAPQKGATPEIVDKMDSWIKNFANISFKTLNIPLKNDIGDGAAGGLGFAFRTYLNSAMNKGVDLILNLTGIAKEFSDTNILITGEGKLDSQTLMGKAPIGVAKLAKSINNKILTIAVCGCIEEEAIQLHNLGIDSYFSIIQSPISIIEAMNTNTAKKNLSHTIEEIFRLITARNKLLTM